MTPLKALWFTGGRGTVGLVKARSDHGEIMYLIGVGEGMHEVIDVNNIANLGARFPNEAAEVLFGKHIEETKIEQDEKQQPVRRARTKKA
jgi:hypothetical protein